MLDGCSRNRVEVEELNFQDISCVPKEKVKQNRFIFRDGFKGGWQHHDTYTRMYTVYFGNFQVDFIHRSI